MKKFVIYMPEKVTFEVLGSLVIPDDVTGQSVIYSKNDPSIQNIAAVVPANALIIVKPQNEE